MPHRINELQGSPHKVDQRCVRLLNGPADLVLLSLRQLLRNIEGAHPEEVPSIPFCQLIVALYQSGQRLRRY